MCRELGIGLVAHSPLGRGYLTGTIVSTDDLAKNDFRRGTARFSDAALVANQAVIDVVAAVAAGHDCTTGQVALAWVLAQSNDVVPIPGTKRTEYLEQNAAAAAVTFSDAALERLAAISVPAPRTSDPSWVDRSTPPLP